MSEQRWPIRICLECGSTDARHDPECYSISERVEVVPAALLDQALEALRTIAEGRVPGNEWGDIAEFARAQLENLA